MFYQLLKSSPGCLQIKLSFHSENTKCSSSEHMLNSWLLREQSLNEDRDAGAPAPHAWFSFCGSFRKCIWNPPLRKLKASDVTFSKHLAWEHMAAYTSALQMWGKVTEEFLFKKSKIVPKYLHSSTMCHTDILGLPLALTVSLFPTLKT